MINIVFTDSGTVLPIPSEPCPVPKSNDWFLGGYHCSGGCINNNKGYLDIQTAWKKCGEIDRCHRITELQGKFYLRKSTDALDRNSKDGQGNPVRYVNYKCKGK